MALRVRQTKNKEKGVMLMSVPKNTEIWNSFDDDVREEVIGLLELCRDSSEMNDESHPKNKQYSEAIALAAKILRK